jgi:carbamoyl-phosphate synthase small subunit
MIENLKINLSKQDALLIFPDGEIFSGKGVGKKNITIAEICFNTSITGYQEILTDPSYLGQIINFTFPHIGNVGINYDDIESKKISASGLIIREDITEPSNYRSKNHLNNWLIENNVSGICKIDTRAITKKIKKSGASAVAIIYLDKIEDYLIEETLQKLKNFGDLSGVELASKASLNQNYLWNNQAKWDQANNIYKTQKEKKYKVVAVDFGSKLNIFRCLSEVGFEVVVVGAKASFTEIISHNPDGIFLSNGPGDPAETIKYCKETILEILKAKIPLFGICLGHQLLALAVGAKTVKMNQGHRGANHPVLNLKSKKVEITSQNHGFCVEKSSVPDNVEITHISLFDQTIEGIKLKNQPAFSVQYHPESSPGPEDSFYLFEEFIQLIKNIK